MRHALRAKAFRRLLAAYGLNELHLVVRHDHAGRARLPAHGKRAGLDGVLPLLSVRPGARLAAVRRSARPASTTAGRSRSCMGSRRRCSGCWRGWPLDFSLVPILAVTLIDGIVALSARAVARTATVDVLRPGRTAARGQRRHQPGLLGLLHGRPGDRRPRGGRRGHGRVAVGQLRAVRGDLADPGWRPRCPPPTSTTRTAAVPGASGCGAAIAHARGDPAVRRLLILQSARHGGVHDLDPGRGRLRPALGACRAARLRGDALGLGRGSGGGQRCLRPVPAGARTDTARGQRASPWRSVSPSSPLRPRSSSR